MKLDELKVIDFGKKIGFEKMNIFITDVFIFYQNNYNYFVSYFSGEIKSLREEDISVYLSIMQKFSILDRKIESNFKKLGGLFDWELVDFIDDLKENMITIPYLWKYFKTERFGFRIRNGYQVDYVLPQGYTLERVSNEIIGSGNFQNDWWEILKGNFLKEKDYTHRGDVKLTLNIPNETGTVLLNSIMDSASGEKILGRDVKSVIEFGEDEDLVALDYVNTFKQTCDILSQVKKYDIPESPDIGVANITSLNQNTKGLGVNLIMKQINRVFATDDSIESVNFKNTEIDGSSIFIDYEISALNSVSNYNKNIVL